MGWSRPGRVLKKGPDVSSAGATMAPREDEIARLLARYAALLPKRNDERDETPGAAPRGDSPTS
jgi:hypothetical protein